MKFKEFTKEELEAMYKVEVPKEDGFVEFKYLEPVILGLEHGITFEPEHYEALRKTSLGKELF